MRGTVYGRVIHGLDGSPATDATVGVAPVAGGNPREPVATDDHGVFVVRDLAEGEWRFDAATSHGTTGATAHVFDNATSDVTLVVEAVEAPRSPKGSKRGTKRSKARPATGSVNGRIIGPDGIPRAGVVVNVSSADGPIPDIQPVTNDDGMFFLDDLPVGHASLAGITVEVRPDAVTYVVITSAEA